MGGVVSSIANVFTGADSTRDAGNAAAAQQSQAARDAAAAAQFRPVGMTTRFGTSSFTRQTDPATGMPYISAASYTPATELSDLQNRLFSQFGGGLTFAEQQALQAQPMAQGAQTLFGLGQQILPTQYRTTPSAEAEALAAQYRQASQGLMPTSFQTGASPEAQAYAQQLQQVGQGYLAKTPEEARQEYIRTQQAALAPGREQQLANVRNQLFQSGRSGLATGGTSQGMAATNPEMAAYYNALANQDLQLAAGAEQAAQQRQTLGLGMLGQGYQTTTAAQQLARENMLQNLGTSLGFGQQGYATTATAEDIARQRSAADISLGAGLFGTAGQLLGSQAAVQTGAYSPLQTILGLSGTTESLSQMPYQLGIQLGQAQQPGQTAGSQMYQQGMNQAAMTQYAATQAANAQNAGFWGGLMQAGGMAAAGGAFGGAGGGLSGLFGGAGGAYGSMGGAAGMGGAMGTGLTGGAGASGLLLASDIRTKENIKLIGKLGNGLNLYSYEYKKQFKNDEHAGHGSFIGVMAHEVEKLIPDAVFMSKNGYKVVNYSLLV